MIQSLHNSRPISIYILEDSVYAIYTDNSEGDVFYYSELDDDSFDLETDLSNTFDSVTVREILEELSSVKG